MELEVSQLKYTLVFAFIFCKSPVDLLHRLLGLPQYYKEEEEEEGKSPCWLLT